jgi:thiamine biosynthesis lipoprotein
MKKNIVSPRSVPLALLWLALLLLMSGCDSAASLQEFKREFFAMDTIVSVTLYAPDQSTADAAFDAAQNEFLRIHQLTDRFAAQNLPDPNASDIYRINQNPGQAVPVSPETLFLIQSALDISRQSQGAFNIAIGPLMDLWDFKGEKHIPTQAELDALLPLTDDQKIQVNTDAGAVTIQPGMILDMGGLAKGYAADCAANALRQIGIRHAIISAGGNVYALGRKPDGSPWRVGIRHPREDGAFLGVVEAVDQAVVSSGDYERYFEADGFRYHHILNPKTGRPASDSISVTVVSSQSLTADLLSTAIFVLGKESMDDLPPRFAGTEALIMDGDGIFFTGGMEDLLYR